MDAEESVALATGTSGNAVLFAGLTVIIALAALVVPGLPFLAVMGLSAAATVAVAVVVALTLTPAVLSLIGREADLQAGLGQGRAAQRRARPREPRTGPGTNTAAATAGAGWSPGTRSLRCWQAWHCWASSPCPPASCGSRCPTAARSRSIPQAYKAYDVTGRSFGEGITGPIVVVGDFPAGLSETEAQAKQFDVADALRSVDNVSAAVPVALSEDRRTAVFQVIPEEGPASASTVQVVSDLRGNKAAIAEATGVSIGLTGQTAGNVDVSAKLGDALPPYLAIVVGLSLILLLLVFRSIVVPLLATGGFLLSLAAAFGAVVAVYQWGWLGTVFDVAEPGRGAELPADHPDRGAVRPGHGLPGLHRLRHARVLHARRVGQAGGPLRLQPRRSRGGRGRDHHGQRVCRLHLLAPDHGPAARVSPWRSGCWWMLLWSG